MDAYMKLHYDVLGSDYLSPLDWEYLQVIEKFLRPFYRVMLEVQSDKATIDQIIFGIVTVRSSMMPVEA